MGIVDGWMDEEDELFLFFFYGWVGSVGGSILALICFLLTSYLCVFFSFGFWERIVVPY